MTELSKDNGVFAAMGIFNSCINCRQDPNIYDLACTQEAVAATIHQIEFINR